MSNNTTLSEFADHESIRRTVNEYATSYDVAIPEDIFDVATFSGYIQYSLTTRDGAPALRVTPNPETDEYGENSLLVAGETDLPVPRGIIEPCAPDDLTDWERDANGFTALLDIPRAETLPGDRLAAGTQAIDIQDGTGVLSLPKHPAIGERAACSVQVAYGADGFEMVITLMSPEADATLINEATTLPNVEIPEALVHALGQDTISVAVFDGGPITTRGALLDKYPAQYGRTARGECSVAETARLPLPEAAVSELASEDITTGVIRVVADEGGVLLVCDGNQSDGDREFTVQDSALACPGDFGRWLALSESEIHWHFHDGTLVGETIASRPSAPAGTRGFIGELDGQTLNIPAPAFEATDLSSEDAGIVATAEGDNIGVAYVEHGGASLPIDAGDSHYSTRLPTAPYESLALEDGDVLLCLPTERALVCIPMDEGQARRRAGVASPDEMEDTRLHIPEDGRDAFVQQVGEGDPAVGVPREATEQFDLEEGSKFALHVGTYNGTLAMYCEPVESEDVTPDVCLGRMLSQSNLRLPIQLVSTLSLFERGITWGLLWEADGPRLVGLIDGQEAPPLSEGLDVGSGEVYTTVKDRDGASGTTHYAVTIPREAFDVYREHPPGVFIGCESIDGTVRLVLTPIGEADLEIIGAVKLRDHWDDDYYEVTLPKSLAAALGCSDDDLASWTFLDGQFVGTLEAVKQF